MISPVIFDTDHSFKRQNALCLTKKSFIKVSINGALLMFSYLLLRGVVMCFGTRRETCVTITAEDLVGKIIHVSPVIFDTNRSFKL